jgi:hypothetical protein
MPAVIRKRTVQYFHSRDLRLYGVASTFVVDSVDAWITAQDLLKRCEMTRIGGQLQWIVVGVRPYVNAGRRMGVQERPHD